MKPIYIAPEFEIIRDPSRCTVCRICEKQCSGGVHRYDEKRGVMVCDESRCVNCKRCVSYCPTHALKIVKNPDTIRENAGWSDQVVREVYKQASSGGVLLSSMGSPKQLPVYWDRILINASQVTNPPIDPLREPMETRVFLGKKPDTIRRRADGSLDRDLDSRIELEMRTDHKELSEHLMLVDLRSHGITGRDLQERLDGLHITLNKNAIPGDPEKPAVTSGVRMGTPCVTTRGFDVADMEVIAQCIHRACRNEAADRAFILEAVAELTGRHTTEK